MATTPALRQHASAPARTGAARLRALARTAVAGLLLALALPAAQADARSCAALSADLARVDANATSPAYRKWDSAARKQKAALSLAERDHRLLGCPAAGGSCATLDAKIRKMRGNLAAIERQRKRHAKGNRSAARAASLRKAMARQGCNGGAGSTTQARRDTTRGDGGGLLSFLGLTGRSSSEAITVSSDPRAGSGSSVRITHSGGGRVGITHMPGNESPRGHGGITYRTMCVRMCDGFFFPVSFSVTDAGFGRDAAICQARCPGAETKLFVHRNPGETVENLVSLEGEPYTDLPNADRFRTTYVSGCGCRDTSEPNQSLVSLTTSGDEAGNDNEMLHAGLREGFTLGEARVEVPAGSDPDTRMNLELGYAAPSASATLPVLGHNSADAARDAARAAADLAAGSTRIGPAEETSPADPDRTVRIVGPRYYVAQ
uniref:DUF2865 domain-containing protein n=1 Tax=Stappia sp. TaxID=1870903 RepID=UPI003BA99D90